MTSLKPKSNDGRTKLSASIKKNVQTEMHDLCMQLTARFLGIYWNKKVKTWSVICNFSNWLSSSLSCNWSWDHPTRIKDPYKNYRSRSKSPKNKKSDKSSSSKQKQKQSNEEHSKGRQRSSFQPGGSTPESFQSSREKLFIRSTENLNASDKLDNSCPYPEIFHKSTSNLAVQQ